jgi:Cu/Ag efflux protein CusF
MNHNQLHLLTLILSCVFVSDCASRSAPAVKTTPTPQAVTTPTPTAAKTQVYHGTGKVTRTNPKFPSVEMDHDEIVGLMPAMRMEFYVKDKGMIEKLKPGDKIEFTLQNGVGGIMITEIKKL